VDRPGTWKPPIAIGDSLGENLSKIELADRKVEQWRAIADYHREHLPEALAKVQESLDAAIRERNKLADTAENRTPRYVISDNPPNSRKEKEEEEAERERESSKEQAERDCHVYCMWPAN